MGDSEKPKAYVYSTAERTDLVEAIWRDLSVQSTTLVAFDFSSLVVLEHLRRRLERLNRREPEGGPDIRGVFIFNGGLFHRRAFPPLVHHADGASPPDISGQNCVSGKGPKRNIKVNLPYRKLLTEHNLLAIARGTAVPIDR
jgi:pimeloyl-ACP methyl ester carboxylesterase